MKKWNEVTKGEKWMFAIIGLLLVGIILRWDFVKEHVGKSFNWFEKRNKEVSAPAAETTAQVTSDYIRFE